MFNMFAKYTFSIIDLFIRDGLKTGDINLMNLVITWFQKLGIEFKDAYRKEQLEHEQEILTQSGNF